jgi:hypothetical protein
MLAALLCVPSAAVRAAAVHVAKGAWRSPPLLSSGHTAGPRLGQAATAMCAERGERETDSVSMYQASTHTPTRASMCCPGPDSFPFVWPAGREYECPLVVEFTYEMTNINGYFPNQTTL